MKEQPFGQLRLLEKVCEARVRHARDQVLACQEQVVSARDAVTEADAVLQQMQHRLDHATGYFTQKKTRKGSYQTMIQHFIDVLREDIRQQSRQISTLVEVLQGKELAVQEAQSLLAIAQQKQQAFARQSAWARQEQQRELTRREDARLQEWRPVSPMGGRHVH